ncbi:hypothetical protein EMPS_06275 [Entomortierella parvispora]|uniref:Uncharacterized protein n=1 Tax=Entomortierella parvispora TaxID=205924 RepID=A0A9P3HC47_9FUNG|nr:hypothetical protein EMPS_06275 [Entomortierella parvispora]
MALKQQQTAPFQLRNPYRLDRPTYDPVEVWDSAIIEEEEIHRRLQLQDQQQAHLQQRPLPPQPCEDTNGSTSWHGIKRIRDYQKKNSSEKRLLKQLHQASQQPQDEGLPSYNRAVSDNSNSQHQHHVQCNSYFGQSWFSQGAFHRTSSSALGNVSSKGAASQMPVPAITVTHHIESHSELTFERHVEWLTQTALWWDMPVVHLYPAPESPVAIEYVETAASKFASWVNFVKIPVKEATRLGPGATAVKAPAPPTSTSRVKGSRAIKSRRDSSSTPSTVDSQEDGGLVTGQTKQHKEEGARPAAESATPGATSTDSIIGYVFVGSADEQAQYHHVFETMERLYPKIEIRYINSFEPHHLQSRRQQELREEPCVHSLSWIHYWSAAKESQVLQSKIVNEVVRVRPMWVNNENLHRNYVPPTPPPSINPASSTATLMSTASSDTLSTELVYVIYEDPKTDDSLRGVPSSVSISSLQDVDVVAHNEDADMNPFQIEQQQEQATVQQEISLQADLSASSDNNMGEQEDDHTVISSLCLEKIEVKRRSLLLKRPSLSRAHSSWDIRHDHHDHQHHLHLYTHDKTIVGGANNGRRSKTWALTSFIRAESQKKSGASVANDYRRSVSAPMLAFSNKSDQLDLGDDEDFTMSPPPSSPTSAGSPTSTSSDNSSKASLSSNSSSSSRLGHRLVHLAQRLGVYKMRESLVMVDM